MSDFDLYENCSTDTKLADTLKDNYGITTVDVDALALIKLKRENLRQSVNRLHINILKNMELFGTP